MELSCVVGYVFVEVIIHIRMWKMELSCGCAVEIRNREGS